MKRILSSIFGVLLLATPALAGNPVDWSQPIRPFQVAGPIWYVGTRGLAAYAIVDRAGTILVSGPMADAAWQVKRNLRAIGVQPGQVKWILNSHAHFDHAGAFADLRDWSGAKLVTSAGDARALRRGRHEADNDNGNTRFAPVTVDRIVQDGEQVEVGRLAITAVLTPGHTRGCTTWTMPIVDAGRPLRVVFPCSLSVAGNHLFGNHGYPSIAADYRRSFKRMAAMRADIVLPMHPETASVLARAARRDAGDMRAFVDRGALARIVADARADYGRAELQKRRR